MCVVECEWQCMVMLGMVLCVLYGECIIVGGMCVYYVVALCVLVLYGVVLFERVWLCIAQLLVVWWGVCVR